MTKSRALGTGILLVAVWVLMPLPLLRWTAGAALLFGVFSGLWSWVVSRGVGFGPPPDQLRIFAGRRTVTSIRVENRSPLPSGPLAIFDSAGGLETCGQPRWFGEWSPFTRKRFSFTVCGRTRGLWTLGPLKVSGSDPAGLFPFTREAEVRSVLVFPPVRKVVGWPSDGIPPGPRTWDPALVDDPSRFRTYREFAPGDSLARISAAAWARTGCPQVRTWDRTVARPSGVVVDLRESRYPQKYRWALVESAVETAASLVWGLVGRDEQVWLTVIDAHPTLPATLGPGKGWAFVRTFLERLALAVPDKTPGEPAGTWAGVLPPVPVRLLWVGPESVDLFPGREVFKFTVDEGESHGSIRHP